jgi:hypothetical protein
MNTSFEGFAAKVVKVLAAHPQGLAWSKIRELEELEQVTPNPTWVYRSEKEYALERVRSKTIEILWRLKPPHTHGSAASPLSS